MTNPSGPQAPLIAYPTHAGVARTIAADGIRHFAGRWLSDGQSIVFVGAESGHRLRYYVQDPAQKGPRAISSENIDFDRGDDLVLSPDGKSVAAMAGQRIQLLHVDGAPPREVPGTSGLTPAAWCRDGGLLAYRRGEMLAHILRIDMQSGKQQKWKNLVPQDQTALTQLGPIRITSDCDTYAYSLQYDPSTLFVVSRLQ